MACSEVIRAIFVEDSLCEGSAVEDTSESRELSAAAAAAAAP